jgi:hypothetical protein
MTAHIVVVVDDARGVGAGYRRASLRTEMIDQRAADRRAVDIVAHETRGVGALRQPDHLRGRAALAK